MGLFMWFDNVEESLANVEESLARIEQQLTKQGELLMSVNEDLQTVTTQLDKVLTEVTTANDELKEQIAALEAAQADPAVVEALKAASQRLDDVNPDAG